MFIRKKAFISHSTTDMDKAGFLASRLGAEGFEVFFAPDSIAVGDPWENKIKDALMSCDLFIVLVSRASRQSAWVRQECDHAIGRGLKIYPLIIDENDAPFTGLENIQHKTITGFRDWDWIATYISRQTQKKVYAILIIALSLLTALAIMLEAKINKRFFYVPVVPILMVSTIILTWLKFSTRSKLLSLLLFLPLAVQLVSVGINIGNLYFTEFSRANESALVLCNTANRLSFDNLWVQFAISRNHPKFKDKLIEVLRGREFSPESKVNALVALVRLEEFDLALKEALTKRGVTDSTVYFDFVRKSDWWLTDSIKLNWLLSWLDKKDSQIVLWGIRALGHAQTIIKAPPLLADAKVRTRLFKLIGETEEASTANNCRWALKELGVSDAEVDQALMLSAASRQSNIIWSNTGGLTFVRINLSEQQVAYISDTEVTTKQFKSFTDSERRFASSAEQQGKSWCFGENGVWFRETCLGASWKDLHLPRAFSGGKDNLPVVHVSWIDAVQFCNWLSSQEGRQESYLYRNGQWQLVPNSKGYRLPTITEWRIASRAGTSTPFWWACKGENCSSNWWYDKGWQCFVANLPDHSFIQWKQINAIAASDGFDFQAPVRTFAPNDWGLFETVGNVGEWGDEDAQFEFCQEHGFGRKPRLGGSWGDDLQAIDVTSCRAEGADTSHVNVGFRVIRTQ